MKIKEKLLIMIGVMILIIMAMGIVFGGYFFGLAGVFELLGVQYNSVWSLFVFVMGFFILGIFVELITKVIFVLSTRNTRDKAYVLMIRLSLEFLSNWLVLFTVDELMKGITLSWKTEVMIALLLAVVERIFDKEDNS
ncbi:YrvL family regulatory protein [Salirhabdus sp. Marseille-P4669]|uniref:YrvL family regulatory protein n=1 Tax=Salirhabdus sp. Marseille-P4669 TaxID=2042310 RepID=UPI000C7BD746|nr:YrvL family regulatory protein [Salirhabdus sp. Marseille-P4669]